MKVLAITYGLPWPLTEGAKIRDFHLLRELSASAQVSLLAFCKDDPQANPVPSLNAFCHSVETFSPPPTNPLQALSAKLQHRLPLAALSFYHPAFAARMEALIASLSPDLVQIEHSFLAPYVTAIPATCRKVLSLHNIGETQYARMAALSPSSPTARLKAFLMRNWEASWAARFNHVITVSPEDAAWLHNRAPQVPVTLIPNGVNTETLAPLRAPTSQDLLFIGVLGYPPNAHAVLDFVRQTLPLIHQTHPSTRLIVVGRNPGPELRALASSNQIELHADVPDVLPFYRRTAISIVPLKAGGGTRLKILEAMSLARPVVSSTIGCEGLGLSSGKQLLIADTPQDTASAISRLLNSPALATQLTTAARAWVEAHHDWRRLGASLTSLHQQLCTTPVP